MDWGKYLTEVDRLMKLQDPPVDIIMPGKYSEVGLSGLLMVARCYGESLSPEETVQSIHRDILRERIAGVGIGINSITITDKGVKSVYKAKK